MPSLGKRTLLGRGKGYLNVAGPQYRFIIFLLIILGAYTFLLKVFQKLAEFVQFPVFLPIALISLLIFIGIAGATYSHTIVGPLLRIRRALEQLSEGEMNISVRLRESDDPMLKDIVKTITALKEHIRNSHALIRESAKDLFNDAEALREMIQRGADKTEMQHHLDGMRKKQDLLDKAIKSIGKA
jgi:methyl-accepting chemotaxis protein